MSFYIKYFPIAVVLQLIFSELLTFNGYQANIMLLYVFNSLLTTIFSILEISLANVFEINNINIIKNLILNRYN